MQTVQDYLNEKVKPLVIFLHALDILDHCMGENPQTAYGDPYGSYQDRHRRDIKAIMDANQEIKDMAFGDLQDAILAPKPKTTLVDSETGEIDIDRYLNGDRLCFDEPVKLPQQVSSMSLILDMGIPWTERDSDAMVYRHREIYRLALQAENNRIPCRVIAAYGTKIPEKRNPLRVYAVVKDYEDPIFPGIWGALETNATANSFTNIIMDYLVGTRSTGNGKPTLISVDDDIDDDTILIIDGKRVKTNKGPR